MVCAASTRLTMLKSFPSSVLLASLAMLGMAGAEVPRKAPLSKYRGLWTNSPFTSKPPPTDAVDAPSPLDDWALAGVSPIAEGYRVTILNKKNPDERKVVETNRPKEGFKVIGVTRKAGDPLGTVVKMMSGSITGTVEFDEKLLVVKAAPPAQPQAKPPIPGQPVGQPQIPGQAPVRQPRPRVVPPPAPGTAPQNNAQPQAQPQAQPAAQNVRPDLRRR
jgi:hypothetical protein